MRLTIHIEPVSGSALLDAHFPRNLQGAIYRELDPQIADAVHEHGFPVGNRSMKLFVFSDVKIQQKPQPEAGGLRFTGPATIVVASPLHEIVSSFGTALLRAGKLRIGREVFNVLRVEVCDPQVTSECIDVRSLSPVVAYSTLLRPEGGKYTCYYQPGEDDFYRIVSQNLARKYRALYGREPDRHIDVTVLRIGRMVIRRFKGTVVKGWHCQLRLRGPQELLKLALDAGLGSKNSQGWGCVELVDNYKRNRERMKTPPP